MPNVTGTLKLNGDAGCLNRNNAFIGAFKPIEEIGNYLTGTSGKAYTVGIDASLSNNVYGNSQTVQPASLTVRCYIKF